MSTWRPLGPAPEDREPLPIGELIDRAAGRLGGPTSATAATVFSGWEQIVGPEIAGHTRPVSLHQGVLVLSVDHPAWASQLRYMTAELLGRIAEAAGTGPGEVTDIRLRVVGEAAPEAPFRRGRKPRP